ncbi:MAG: hypothetical protein ABIP36_06610 [Acidimicrobiales bacterium]
MGAALLANACQTDREVTKPEPQPVTEERVSAALLTIADLPDTFTAAEPATSIATDLVPEHECDDAITQLDPEQVATADFTSPGARLTSTVASFPGQGGAVEQLYRDVAEDCAEVVITAANLSLRTRRLDFGVLSDDTLPLQMELEPATGAIEERDLILMREGDVVSLVRLTGPRPSDKELLDTVVRVALGRLGFLAQETSP